MGRNFPTGHPEMFLVDVFRDGGGIYAAYPNRILMCSERNGALMTHVGIAHEGGYLVCKGWEKEPKDVKVNQKAGKYPRLTIEEHAMALIQSKMDEYYTRLGRKTHGYMGNRFLKTLDNHWNEYISKSERSISDLITKAILDASKDAQTLEELSGIGCGYRIEIQLISY